MTKSLCKSTIVKRIKALANDHEISISEIVLIMGTALVMYEIRERCADIDITCSTEVFRNLLEKGYSLCETRSGRRKVIVDEISIYENWPYSEKYELDGLFVCGISDIVSTKRVLARQKDMNDIVLVSKKYNKRDQLSYYQVYSYPNILRGMLHQGKGKEIALIISGYFSANRVGVNRFFLNMANAINSLGMPVLRIDLSCMGESEGDFNSLQFCDHTVDLFTTICDLKEKGYERFHLIGHCEGCYTVVEMLKYFDCISSIILISPVFSNNETLLKFFGEEGLQQLSNQGFTYRKGLRCNKSFFNLDEILLNNQYLKEIDVARVTVIMAEKDEYADNERVLTWALDNGFNHFAIPNANHNYTDEHTRQQLFSVLLNRLSEGEDG